eukprot:scaffold129947_cov53-Prasinocladus_malaysianus.AAC.1
MSSEALWLWGRRNAWAPSKHMADPGHSLCSLCYGKDACGCPWGQTLGVESNQWHRISPAGCPQHLRVAK